MPDQQLLTRIVIRGEDRSKPAIRSARQGLRSVSEGLERIGTLAQRALVIGAPVEGLRRGATAAIRSFASIQTALVGVQKTTDLSDAALARLDRRLADLSLDPSVALTRVELLGIAQAAGQLGVRGVEHLERFSATIAQLAAASPDLGAEEAATALARLLKVTGEGVGSIDRLASSIARAGNTFAASEGEITRAALRVGIATANYRVATEEAVALGAALRDLGIEAELGATAIGLGFQALDQATRGGDGAQRLVELTGRSLADLRQQFEADATDVFRDFVAGLADVRAQGGDVVQILDELGLSGARSNQVYGTLAGRVDVLDAALADMADEWERNTALTTESLRAADTFSRQMQLVANEIDSTAAALGSAMAPALLVVAQRWEAVGLVAAAAAARGVTATGQHIRRIGREAAVERRAARARIANALEQRRAIAALAARQRDLAAVRAQDAARELSAVRATTVARTQHGVFIERERRSQARLATATTRAASAAQQHAQAVRTAERATASIERAQRRYNRALAASLRLKRAAGVAIAALGGPLGALLTVLSVAATAWAIWGRAAKDATAEAEEAARAAQDRVRSRIESTRPPGDLFAADVQVLRAELDAALEARQRLTADLSRSIIGGALQHRAEARDDRGSPSVAAAIRHRDALPPAEQAIAAGIVEAQATIDTLRPLLAQVPAAAARLRAAFAGGGDGTGGDTLFDGLLGGEPAEALARIRDGILDAEAARRGALDALIREEQKALAEIDALQGQQGVDEKERLDLRIRTQEEFQSARLALIERGRSEEAEAERQAAAAAAREREAAHARAEQAEEQRLERRRQRIEDAAEARADVARQLDSGRDALATPWERATVAIERWEAAARRAVALQHETAVAAAAAGPDAALHRAAAAARAEAGYARVTELSARQRIRAREDEARRSLAASRRWQDGVTRGLRRVREETTNYARIAERAVTGAFQSMADGIEEFVRTGKLSFGGLVESVLAGLARIALQHAALGLFNLLPFGRDGLFGIGTGNSHLPPSVDHTGGIAGALGGVRRAGVPAAAFAGARRLHAGGLASDEVPAILRRGEGVFTPEQMRALGPASPPEVRIEFENRGTAQRQAAPANVAWDGRRLVVGVVLEDLEQNGPLSQGLQQRFALPPRV